MLVLGHLQLRCYPGTLTRMLILRHLRLRC
jgi:hypothetical protein